MSAQVVAARPYARAAFEWAREQDRLQEWSDQLELLAEIAANEDMQAILSHPRHGGAEKAQLILDVAAQGVDEGAANLVRILAENGRLNSLPAVADAYREMKASTEHRIDAVATAFRKLTQAQSKALQDALAERLRCDVALETKVDASLLGGVVIRAGDLVIDGSVRGQLQRLASQLSR